MPRELVVKVSLLRGEAAKPGDTITRFGKQWRLVAVGLMGGTVRLREVIRSPGRRAERAALRGGKTDANAVAQQETLDVTGLESAVRDDAQFMQLAREAKMAQRLGRDAVYTDLVAKMRRRYDRILADETAIEERGPTVAEEATT